MTTADQELKNAERWGKAESKLILDLCGGTGSWSKPYKDAGYDVRLFDLPNDVRMVKYIDEDIHGILMAPPCTRFSFARNRYPASEDELKDALSIVDACLRFTVIHKPKWWALENPRNLLRQWLGEPRLKFEHWWYGDGQIKPTFIWGEFNFPQYNPGKRNKPSTFKTKKQNADPKDAITSPEFAKAFYEANK